MSTSFRKGEWGRKWFIAAVMMLALVLVAALCRVDSNPSPAPVPVDGRPVLKTTPTRNVAPVAPHVTPPTQPAAGPLTAMVKAETNLDRRSEVLERAAESISDAELPAMLDALVLETNSWAPEMSLLLVSRWAERDPAAAAAWAARLGTNSLSQGALKQVAVAWANTNLTAAANWVRSLPDGAGRHAATISLAYEAARTEPRTALDLAASLPATRERDDLLAHAVSQWAGADPSTAADWTLKVPDPTLRQRLVAAAAIALAERDAVAAVTLTVNGLAAGEEQDRAAVSIVQRWAQQSPQNAASWVAQFPNIPSREAAVENLLSIWATQDYEAAENWRRKL